VKIHAPGTRHIGKTFTIKYLTSFWQQLKYLKKTEHALFILRSEFVPINYVKRRSAPPNPPRRIGAKVSRKRQALPALPRALMGTRKLSLAGERKTV